MRRRTTAIDKQFQVYLGSVISVDETESVGCGKDVDGRIKVAWSRRRGISGVICDTKVPVNLKSKLCQNSGQTYDGVWE